MSGRFLLCLLWATVTTMVALAKLELFIQREQFVLLPLVPLFLAVSISTATIAYICGKRDQFDEDTRRTLL